MSRVIVVGSGIVGLTTALMLSQQGLAVTVLDRDEVAPTTSERAWSDWRRRGVPQFRQPHFLLSAGYGILRSRLPQVATALHEAGGTRFDFLSLLPRTVRDRAHRAGDERFVTVTARRPVMEHAVASCAGRLDLRSSVTVTGLLAGPSALAGVPHVRGVRTSTGEELAAELVVDATGRRSALPKWLAALGTPPIEEHTESASFAYYTRYFRAADGSPVPQLPPFPDGGLGRDFDSFSLLTLPGDGDTWSITVYISAHDTALKQQLRHTDRWTAFVRACPPQAGLLEGVALTDIHAISGLLSKWRDFSIDDTPVATGVVAIGDALCATNPILGRGITFGLMQAEGLTDAVAMHLDDPAALVRAYQHTVETRIRPWYRATVDVDRVRREQVHAVIEGRPMSPDAAAASARRDALFTAMTHDASVFRAFADTVNALALPADALARPGVAERIAEAAEQIPDSPSASGPFRV